MQSIFIASTPLQLRAALLARGFTLQTVAQRCGVNKSTVSRVLTRQARSRRVEGHVCQLLGLPRQSVFGLTKPEARKLQRRRTEAA